MRKSIKTSQAKTQNLLTSLKESLFGLGGQGKEALWKGGKTQKETNLTEITRNHHHERTEVHFENTYLNRVNCGSLTEILREKNVLVDTTTGRKITDEKELNEKHELLEPVNYVRDVNGTLNDENIDFEKGLCFAYDIDYKLDFEFLNLLINNLVKLSKFFDVAKIYKSRSGNTHIFVWVKKEVYEGKTLEELKALKAMFLVSLLNWYWFDEELTQLKVDFATRLQWFTRLHCEPIRPTKELGNAVCVVFGNEVYINLAYKEFSDLQVAWFERAEADEEVLQKLLSKLAESSTFYRRFLKFYDGRVCKVGVEKETDDELARELVRRCEVLKQEWTETVRDTIFFHAVATLLGMTAGNLMLKARNEQGQRRRFSVLMSSYLYAKGLAELLEISDWAKYVLEQTYNWFVKVFASDKVEDFMRRKAYISIRYKANFALHPRWTQELISALEPKTQIIQVLKRFYTAGIFRGWTKVLISRKLLQRAPYHRRNRLYTRGFLSAHKTVEDILYELGFIPLTYNARNEAVYEFTSLNAALWSAKLLSRKIVEFELLRIFSVNKHLDNEAIETIVNDIFETADAKMARAILGNLLAETNKEITVVKSKMHETKVTKMEKVNFMPVQIVAPKMEKPKVQLTPEKYPNLYYWAPNLEIWDYYTEQFDWLAEQMYFANKENLEFTKQVQILKTKASYKKQIVPKFELSKQYKPVKYIKYKVTNIETGIDKIAEQLKESNLMDLLDEICFLCDETNFYLKYVAGFKLSWSLFHLGMSRRQKRQLITLYEKLLFSGKLTEAMKVRSDFFASVLLANNKVARQALEAEFGQVA